jgi:hypothetical protein
MRVLLVTVCSHLNQVRAVVPTIDREAFIFQIGLDFPALGRLTAAPGLGPGAAGQNVFLQTSQNSTISCCFDS